MAGTQAPRADMHVESIVRHWEFCVGARDDPDGGSGPHHTTAGPANLSLQMALRTDGGQCNSNGVLVQCLWKVKGEQLSTCHVPEPTASRVVCGQNALLTSSTSSQDRPQFLAFLYPASLEPCPF